MQCSNSAVDDKETLAAPGMHVARNDRRVFGQRWPIATWGPCRNLIKPKKRAHVQLLCEQCVQL